MSENKTILEQLFAAFKEKEIDSEKVANMFSAFAHEVVFALERGDPNELTNLFRTLTQLRCQLHLRKQPDAVRSDNHQFQLGKLTAFTAIIAVAERRSFSRANRANFEKNQPTHKNDKRILDLLYENEALQASEITEALRLDKNEVSERLTQLIEKKWVLSQRAGKPTYFRLTLIGRQALALQKKY